MSNLGEVAQGDRRTVAITLMAGNAPVNITGADISGWKRNRRTGVETELDGVLSVSDGAAGVMTWARGVEDTGTPGPYDIGFLVTVGGVDYRTLPARWVVVASPGYVVEAAP